ncbi:MAG: helix-turn-helix transcriptional regulator [Dorea sp.]|nr:helix-turn-helix transcriptional regulator [Dorea sp.]
MKIYSYKGKKNLCGNRIREARLKQRISQSDLAARVQIEGITLERDSISRIEIGTRFVTDYELKIFAKVLQTNIEWLLKEDEK